MGIGGIIPLPTSALQWVNTVNLTTAPAISSGWSGFTIVSKYQIGALAVSGNPTRITVKAASSAGGTLSAIYIGQVATSGNAYNFDGGQVQVLFGGSGSLTLTAGGGPYLSDDIAFSIDQSRAICLAYNVTGTTTLARLNSLGSNYVSYYRNAVAQAASTLKSSDYTVAAGAILNCFKIEVSA